MASSNSMVETVMATTGLYGVLAAEICSFVDGLLLTPSIAAYADQLHPTSVSLPLTNSSQDVLHAVKLCDAHPGCGASSACGSVTDDIMDACLGLEGDRTALYLVYACIGAWLAGPTADDSSPKALLPALLFYVHSVKPRDSFLAAVASKLVMRNRGVCVNHNTEAPFAFAQQEMDSANCWLSVYEPGVWLRNEQRPDFMLSVISQEPVGLPVKWRPDRQVARFKSNGALLFQQGDVSEEISRRAFALRCIVIAEHPEAVAISRDPAFYDRLFQKTQCCWLALRSWLDAHPQHPHITLQSLCKDVPFFVRSASRFVSVP